ncbi:membrane hypothetical protein [Frigoribacterium sp. 9N]|nr:membrane hypothetical protein [Frigoribacterium sp. 9N]
MRLLRPGGTARVERLRGGRVSPGWPSPRSSAERSSRMDWLLSVPLLSTTMLLTVDVVAALVAVGLLVRPRTRRTWWRWIALAVLLGAGLGALATWWLGDVRDVLGLSPTWVDRLWVAAVVAGVAVVVVNLFRTRWWRKLVAVLAVLVFALAGGLALNRDGSVYQNLSQALGRDEVPALPATAAAPPSAAPGSTDFDPTLWSAWKAPADLPAVGRFGSVAIPGAVSHFPARDPSGCGGRRWRAAEAPSRCCRRRPPSPGRTRRAGGRR